METLQKKKRQEKNHMPRTCSMKRRSKRRSRRSSKKMRYRGRPQSLDMTLFERVVTDPRESDEFIVKDFQNDEFNGVYTYKTRTHYVMIFEKKDTAGTRKPELVVDTHQGLMIFQKGQTQFFNFNFVDNKANWANKHGPLTTFGQISLKEDTTEVRLDLSQIDTIDWSEEKSVRFKLFGNFDRATKIRAELSLLFDPRVQFSEITSDVPYYFFSMYHNLEKSDVKQTIRKHVSFEEKGIAEVTDSKWQRDRPEE